ncbi:MAG: hypothetical protein KAY24_16490 [Candidatus Eisenbacteria sp.]|nr:hypothetical protein [Candidatus Eisenbacteria bacterium]
MTLIECKFTARPVDTTVIDDVARKIKFLGTPSQYTVERVLISAGGVTPNLARSDYFHQIGGRGEFDARSSNVVMGFMSERTIAECP